jgi:hypothetical protein
MKAKVTKAQRDFCLSADDADYAEKIKSAFICEICGFKAQCDVRASSRRLRRRHIFHHQVAKTKSRDTDCTD